MEIEIGIDKAQKTQQKTTEIASMIEEPFRVITMNRKTSHHDEQQSFFIGVYQEYISYLLNGVATFFKMPPCETGSSNIRVSRVKTCEKFDMHDIMA